MGLSSKQVSRDGVLGWNQALLQAHTLELPKPPPSMKRQQPTNQPEQAEPLKCPRCDSDNTKFCYYNNYNKSQPRHFCKTCKRHWTKGGTLRNVPVGGGRKNKRLKTSNAAAAAQTTTVNSNRVNNTDVGIQCDQPPMIRQNLGFAFGDQKNLSEILYRATIHHHHQPPPVPSSSNLEMKDRICSSTTVSPPSQNQNQSLLFLPYSTSTSFDTTSSSIYAGETLDDPTITSTFMPTTTCSTVISTQPWQLSTAISSSTAMEYSTSYWNWDDVDTFASTDLINIPNWVDESHDHIKP